MNAEPGNMFQGLPLTPEQDSEVRHYIHGRQRNGLPWDTPELHAMIADMLDPPERGEEDGQSLSASMSTEQAAARQDGEADRDRTDTRGTS